MAQAVTFTRIQPWMGAEVHGVDATKPVPEDVAEQLRAAWAKYKVLVFRDQDITREQHLEFSRVFGPLAPHAAEPVPGWPEIGPIESGQWGTLLEWHSDECYYEVPPRGAVMRAFTVPSIGGETGFTNNVRAFEMLDEDLKERLRHYTVFQESDVPAYQRFKDEARWRRAIEEHPSREQPMVIVLPETGEECLFINPSATKRIIGLSEAESRELLQRLFWHMVKLEFQVRARWKPHTIVIWDQRATMHNAVIDFNEPRYFERTTIAGVPLQAARPRAAKAA